MIKPIWIIPHTEQYMLYILKDLYILYVPYILYILYIPYDLYILYILYRTIPYRTVFTKRVSFLIS